MTKREQIQNIVARMADAERNQNLRSKGVHTKVMNQMRREIQAIFEEAK